MNSIPKNSLKLFLHFPLFCCCYCAASFKANSSALNSHPDMPSLPIFGEISGRGRVWYQIHVQLKDDDSPYTCKPYMSPEIWMFSTDLHMCHGVAPSSPWKHFYIFLTNVSKEQYLSDFVEVMELSIDVLNVLLEHGTQWLVMYSLSDK